MENQNASYHGSSSGLVPAQCSPMPQPALGFQRIIQGNGTTVGTVISLQCPAKHKLIGDNVKCVMAANSTHWEGVTYCKPLSYNETYGFQLAVLISIVSTAIICLMSMAFLTCCLVDCIENSKRKKLDRDSETVPRWEEQGQHQREMDRPRYSNRSRNNNNNNIMELGVTPWNHNDLGQGESSHSCRCLQQYGYGPSGSYASSYDGTSQPTPLPGNEFTQPLLPQNLKYSQPYSDSQHQYIMHSAQEPTTRSSLVWEYGAQESSLPQVTNQSDRRNNNSGKEFSIRVITV